MFEVTIQTEVHLRGPSQAVLLRKTQTHSNKRCRQVVTDGSCFRSNNESCPSNLRNYRFKQLVWSATGIQISRTQHSAVRALSTRSSARTLWIGLNPSKDLGSSAFVSARPTKRVTYSLSVGRVQTSRTHVGKWSETDGAFQGIGSLDQGLNFPTFLIIRARFRAAQLIPR